MEVATALDFDEVLYLCRGRGRKKQLNKKYNIQNSDRNREPKVPEHQLQAKITFNFPHRVQSTFLCTISKVQFLLGLKHGKNKPQGQLAIASEKHYFLRLCPKTNVLQGQRK